MSEYTEAHKVDESGVSWVKVEYANRTMNKSTRSQGCSMAQMSADHSLIEIYQTQAVEAAMYLMSRLNRGQIKRIREANPNLADLYAECLSR